MVLQKKVQELKIYEMGVLLKTPGPPLALAHVNSLISEKLFFRILKTAPGIPESPKRNEGKVGWT